MQKITARNYHVQSTGTFKAVPRSWTKKVLGQIVSDHMSLKRWSMDCFVPEVRLGNKVWRLHYVSAKPNWKSMSIYYVSIDGRWLLRFSNHWTDADSRTCKCGFISKCLWWLEGHQAPLDYKSNKQSLRVKHHAEIIGGMIPFDEMHWRG